MSLDEVCNQKLTNALTTWSEASASTTKGFLKSEILKTGITHRAYFNLSKHTCCDYYHFPLSVLTNYYINLRGKLEKIIEKPVINLF